MPKSLADGHIRLSILTAKPANPAAPTVAELNAGIGGATGVTCSILSSDFQFGATDSDKVSEKALCVVNNAEALGASNYQAALTAFRFFDAATKNAHATEDALFQAIKVKGTTLWLYARETAKLSTDVWVTADEIFLGAEVITDTPQRLDGSGYIKRRSNLLVQTAYENITAA